MAGVTCPGLAIQLHVLRGDLSSCSGCHCPWLQLRGHEPFMEEPLGARHMAVGIVRKNLPLQEIVV
jgi:hypothetical protein